MIGKKALFTTPSFRAANLIPLANLTSRPVNLCFQTIRSTWYLMLSSYGGRWQIGIDATQYYFSQVLPSYFNELISLLLKCCSKWIPCYICLESTALMWNTKVMFDFQCSATHHTQRQLFFNGAYKSISLS